MKRYKKILLIAFPILLSIVCVSGCTLQGETKSEDLRLVREESPTITNEYKASDVLKYKKAKRITK